MKHNPALTPPQFETVSHRGIIMRAGGPAQVAASLGIVPPVSRETVKSWARTDSIPGPYWLDFVIADLATHRELAEAAAIKRRASAD